MESEAGGNNKKYEVESICDSTIYDRKLEASGNYQVSTT